MTKDNSYRRPRIDSNGGGPATTQKGYNWVNDPFTDKLPYERHTHTYKVLEAGRKSSGRTKGRAANL